MTVALTFAIVQNGMPMKFVDLISYYHIPYVSEKGIAIWKINSEIREEENIPGIDSHAILFVVGGSMEISVQGKIQYPAGPRHHRGDQERPHPDHHYRDPVYGQQGPPHREHGRPCQGEAH